MTDYILCETMPSQSPTGQPSWVVEQMLSADRASSLELLGNEDFVTSPPAYLQFLTGNPDSQVTAILAVTGLDPNALPRGRYGLPAISIDVAEAPPPGHVLGWSSIVLNMTDNRHLVDLHVYVDPDVRRQGIGTHLLEVAEDLSRTAGRTTCDSFVTTKIPGPGDELTAKTGVGAISRSDCGVQFALHHNFVLEQVERYSQLDLPVQSELLEKLWAESLPRADGYRLVTFLGDTPEPFAQGYADLLQHFSTQAPIADLDWQEERWDVERLRRREELRTAAHTATLTTLAIHEASGTVVAESDLNWSLIDQPELACQHITIVDADHRGHRLGMLVKVQNLVEFMRREPGRNRITTWNAGENEWMLAINVALGFYPKAAGGSWEKKLTV